MASSFKFNQGIFYMASSFKSNQGIFYMASSFKSNQGIFYMASSFKSNQGIFYMASSFKSNQGMHVHYTFWHVVKWFCALHYNYVLLPVHAPLMRAIIIIIIANSAWSAIYEGRTGW